MAGTVFRKITRRVGKAIGDFDLIRDGDRVLVGLSGGKDSWSLLHALGYLRRKAPVSYEVAAVIVHPGSPHFDPHPIQERLERDGIQYEVVPGKIVEIVNEKLSEGTNPCAFCSRLRRGILYSYAIREGWTKIALGHHADDVIETLLLNLMFNATIKGMSPYLTSDDGRNIVIRPLVYVSEQLTRAYADEAGVPLIDCGCHYKVTDGRREWTKRLITDLEKDIPDVRSHLLSAMGRVRARHLFTTGLARPEDERDDSDGEDEDACTEENRTAAGMNHVHRYS